MSSLNLLCLSFQECHLLPQITSSLSEILSLPVTLGKIDRHLNQYFQKDRDQYDASRILSDFEKTVSVGKTVLITSVDLYIPIFTYVFGLAKLKGDAAIVSAYRLDATFYGLPKDETLLKQRLVKEVIHELGHLLNLRHCSDYRCVMSSSNTADELDVKQNRYCQYCLDDISEFLPK
jgi:archaemetzincin